MVFCLRLLDSLKTSSSRNEDVQFETHRTLQIFQIFQHISVDCLKFVVANEYTSLNNGQVTFSARFLVVSNCASFISFANRKSDKPFWIYFEWDNIRNFSHRYLNFFFGLEKAFTNTFHYSTTFDVLFLNFQPRSHTDL